MSRPKIYLIDGHSLAYRAFYALPTSMVTTNGQITNALYGFARMLMTIIEEKKPDAIAVAFDRPEPTFRHQAYKEYKAHRPPSPEEFRSQLPLIKEMINTFNIPIYELSGFEADDILGTLSVKAVEEGFDVKIITGDRDAFQLVNDHVHVILPIKGLSEIKEFDIKAVEEKYSGLKPDQLIDLKALTGDQSDNIPGISGIGEKTAAALLQEFKTLDGIYSRIEDVPRETVRNKLKENMEIARQSRFLAEIKLDVPFEFKIDVCSSNNLDWEKVIEFLKNYQLNSLVKKYKPEQVPATAQESLFSTQNFSDEKAPLDKEKVLQARLKKYLLNPERQYKDEDISQNDIDSITEYGEQLKARGLYNIYKDIELPLASILEDMEKNGVRLDVPFLSRMSKDLEHFIQGLEQAIYTLAGQTFNINSPKQLSEIFFEKLKLPTSKKTKTGFSTDASVLEELAIEHDIARKILEYRQLTKLKSTYVDALPLLVNPKTGKIHTHFNQTATATGRLSSSEPNLQNIPIRTEMGRKIRQAFIPDNENNIILTADYSQIELRILAHIADEKRLISAFENNLDIHRATAAEVFGIPLNQVTEIQRSQAKAVNFGIAYGMAARRLAQTVNISYAEAQIFIDNYFNKYPGIKKYIDRTIALAREQGFVTTLFNRRRYFSDINSPNKRLAAEAERAAINTPIQGTASDFIKIAMINIAKELVHQKLKAKMIIQVHDELVFDVPQNEAYDLECLVKKQMENVYKLKVPLVVNTGNGKNWLEAK